MVHNKQAIGNPTTQSWETYECIPLPKLCAEQAVSWEL